MAGAATNFAMDKCKICRRSDVRASIVLVLLFGSGALP